MGRPQEHPFDRALDGGSLDFPTKTSSIYVWRSHLLVAPRKEMPRFLSNTTQPSMPEQEGPKNGFLDSVSFPSNLKLAQKMPHIESKSMWGRVPCGPRERKPNFSVSCDLVSPFQSGAYDWIGSHGEAKSASGRRGFTPTFRAT